MAGNSSNCFDFNLGYLCDKVICDQCITDGLYRDSSLADLYDEVTMPPELRKVHQQNDRAVMDAYGFTKGTEARTSESACVAELMKLYQKLTETQ